MINRIKEYIKDNQFKITFVNNCINIINYDKIIELNDKEITVMNNKNVVMIRGNNLKLTKLLDNEILITGLINKIEM